MGNEPASENAPRQRSLMFWSWTRSTHTCTAFFFDECHCRKHDYFTHSFLSLLRVLFFFTGSKFSCPSTRKNATLLFYIVVCFFYNLSFVLFLLAFICRPQYGIVIIMPIFSVILPFISHLPVHPQSIHFARLENFRLYNCKTFVCTS